MGTGVLIILGVVMFLALGGMVYCNKKQETFELAQPVAFVLLGVVLVCGGLMLYGGCSNDGDAIGQSEERFSASRALIAGEYLKGKNVTSVALFIEPGLDPKAGENLRDALKEAGIGEVAIVEITTAKKLSGEMVFFETVTSKDLDNAFKKAGNVNGYVFATPLPSSVLGSAYWRGGKYKPTVFLDRPEFGELKEMITRGMINGVVIIKNKVNYDEKAPSNLKKAFDLRYTLITDSNVASLGK